MKNIIKPTLLSRKTFLHLKYQLETTKAVISALLLLTLCCSCKVNRISHGVRVGRWKEVQEIDGHEYKFISKYNSTGKERGRWITYVDGQLNKEERYSGNNTSEIRTYYAGKKLQSIGKTRLDVHDHKGQQLAHWYYYGNWKFYKEDGRPMFTRTYDKGQLIKEVSHE